MNQHLKNKRIAFVTSKDYRELTDSDRLASIAFRDDGAQVIPAVWDDPSVDWKGFDIIVVRSPWDYFRHIDRFLRWIDSVESQNVWNPVSILRWNMNKRYLFDLAGKGIRIPRTVIFDKESPFDPSLVTLQLGAIEVVIKPVVSASAWNTWRCSLDNFSNEDRLKANGLLSTMDIMVQEFMPEIATEGEWSLIFFGDKFSHAVQKYPGKGDFRVQNELGGRYNAEPNPPDDLVWQAKNVLATIKTPLLYARVDGIVREGAFVLMELELFEPALFFDVYPGGVQRFCDRMVELMDVK